MSISSRLTQLAGIKAGIKSAIIAKGVTVGDDMTAYATAISSISGSGSSDPFLVETADVTMSSAATTIAAGGNIGAVLNMILPGWSSSGKRIFLKVTGNEASGNAGVELLYLGDLSPTDVYHKRGSATSFTKVTSGYTNFDFFYSAGSVFHYSIYDPSQI